MSVLCLFCQNQQILLNIKKNQYFISVTLHQALVYYKICLKEAFTKGWEVALPNVQLNDKICITLFQVLFHYPLCVYLHDCVIVHSPKRLLSEGYRYTFLTAASGFHSRDHLNINPLDLISYIVKWETLVVWFRWKLHLEDEGTQSIYTNTCWLLFLLQKPDDAVLTRRVSGSHVIEE